MLKTRWFGRKGQAKRQRGAAIVEAGLIFPLLMFLIFGIIEVGHTLSAYSSGANAVRAGGRMASVQGSDLSADMETIRRVAEESTAIREGEIQYVIVWEATGVGDEVPLGCLAAADSLGTHNTGSVGVAGSCNVYGFPQAAGGAFDMAMGLASNPDPMHYFGCTDLAQAAAKLDCNWSPQDRETIISPRGVTPRVEPDFVGVYIRIEYQNLTGLLGPSRTITDNSITMIEPDNFGVG